MKRTSRRRATPSLLVRAVIFTAMAGWAVFQVAPILIVFFNSLKSDAEYVADPIGLPPHFRWQNYVAAIQGGPTGVPLLGFMRNSVIVTLGTLVLVLIAGAMAAYAISKYRGRMSRTGGTLVLLALAIPVHAALIPIFVYMGQLGLRNSLLGLVLVYSAFWLPLAILILRGFYATFPDEIIEAARIDGSSELGIFFRIVLPLSVGPMVGVGIVTAIGVWSELLFALTLTNRDEFRTLTVGLSQFRTSFATSWHLVFAGLMISIAPLLVAYAAFQRQIQRGLAEGAIR